jgi:hypothetical protein
VPFQFNTIYKGVDFCHVPSDVFLWNTTANVPFWHARTEKWDEAYRAPAEKLLGDLVEKQICGGAGPVSSFLVK